MKIKRKEYLKRELLGVILFPIILAIVAYIFVYAGLIKEEYSEMYWMWVITIIIAGIIAFVLTYAMVFSKRRIRR